MSNTLYWLHAPIETTRGDWLKPPPDCRLTVLGRPATLHGRLLQNQSSLTNFGTGVVAQWLLFDPMPEADAETMLSELRSRMPVVSLRQNAAMRIGVSALHRTNLHLYNGPIPTLIPETLKPDPIWVDASIQSFMDAKHTLETILDSAPAVKDERILAALDLKIAAKYDSLPRSQFLAQLTIVDSLSVRKDRSAEIRSWIDDKIIEAEKFNDIGLVSSLRNLKQGSHSSAIRKLTEIAAKVCGHSNEEALEWVNTASKLYSTRSALSHAGSTKEILDVTKAEQLASLILEAAIQQPSILD